MHWVNPDKDSNAFQEEFQAIADLTSSYHRGSYSDFTAFEFPARFTCTNLTFKSVAVFRSIVAPIGVFTLKDVVFKERADFSNADLVYGLVIHNSIFEGDTVLTGAKFDVMKIVDTRFDRDLSLDQAQCWEDSYVERCKFSGRVTLLGAKFGELHYSDSSFNVGLSAPRAMRLTSFRRVQIAKTLDITAVPVHACEELELKGDGIFSHCKFETSVDLRATQFSRVVFRHAAFQSDVDLSGSVFESEADFHATRFGGRMDLSDTTFHCIADFSAAKFEAPHKTHFVGIRGEPRGWRVRFAGCDFEGAKFEAINWYREDGRIVLQDELDLRSSDTNGKPDAETVVITYRRFVRTFQSALAFDDMEDCVWGEMEAKRRHPDISWFTRAVLYAYRQASSYGSNPWRALVVTLVLALLVFPLVYASPTCMLRQEGNQPVSAAAVAHRHAFGESMIHHVLLLSQDAVVRASARGGAAIIHSLETATLRGTTVYQCSAGAGYVVSILESVFVPAQVALLLLALRRRFSR